MALIQSFLAFNLFWTIGRAIVSFFLAITTGAAVYALSKFVLVPELENFIFPAIPAFVGCMMREVEWGTSASIVLAAYQARLTLTVIRWANRGIMG